MELIAKKELGEGGRLVIPNEIRDLWGSQTGSTLFLYMHEGALIVSAVDILGHDAKLKGSTKT